MLYDRQFEEKLVKVKIVVQKLLKEKKTISEISKETNIPSSSVQRYLNDEAFIKMIFKDNYEFIMEEIKMILNKNKQEGKRLGGQHYASNNEYIKDEVGHFKGSRKR